MESDPLCDGSDFDIGDDFVSAIDVGSLVCVTNGERVFQGNRGDSVAGDKGPINATNLGPGVDYGGGGDGVQGGRGEDRKSVV